MSDILLYDTATGNGLSIVKSVNTPDYEGKPGVLVNPDKALLAAVPATYIRVVEGIAREMTSPEKAAVDAAKPPAPVLIETTVAAHETKIKDHEERIVKLERP